MNQYAVDTDRTLSKRSIFTRFAYRDGIYYSLTKAASGATAANRLLCAVCRMLYCSGLIATIPGLLVVMFGRA